MPSGKATYRQRNVLLTRFPFSDLVTKRIHETAVQGYLPSGMVDEKLQREMIASAAQRIKPPQPVTPKRVCDFSFARKAGENLR